MKLSDFTLMKEEPDHYVVGHPQGRSMKIMKEGLSDKAHEHIKKMADGGSVFDDPADTVSKDVIPLTESEKIAQGVPSATPESTKAVEAAPDMNDPGYVNQVVQASQAAPASAPEAAPMPAQAAPPSPFPNLAPALDTYQKDLNAGIAAEQKMGQQMAQAYQPLVDYTKDAIKTEKEHYEDFTKKDRALEQAFMDKKIDPNSYWAKKGTASKVMSSIGLILGGIGSGLTGQPNLAANMIKENIDRDIDAQKEDKGSAMNLWKMNRDHFQDDRQARLATQNQMLTAAQAQVNQATALAKGPMARERLAATSFQINQMKEENRAHLALMKAQSNGGMAEVDPSLLVQRLVKDPTQQKQVYAEISAAQNTNHMRESIMKNFEDAAKENTILRTGFGHLRTPGSVLGLHQALQPTFADLEGTVRQAAMDNTFNNVTPMAGDSEYKINQKRATLMHYLESKASAPTAKGNGIDLQKFKSTSSDPSFHMDAKQNQFLNWAKANPKNPKAAMVLQKLGVY